MRCIRSLSDLRLEPVRKGIRAPGDFNIQQRTLKSNSQGGASAARGAVFHDPRAYSRQVLLGHWKFLVGYWIFSPLFCAVPLFGWGRREPTIDGMPVDEFVAQNADPIWLHQNGMYEELHQWEQQRDAEENEFLSTSAARDDEPCENTDEGLPF